MKFKQKVHLEDLIKEYKLELLCHNSDEEILGLNEIHKVEKGDITFVDTSKYYDRVIHSKASYIIANSRELECPESTILYSSNPFKTYNAIALKYFPSVHRSESMSSENHAIGENTTIYPNVYMGENVSVGKNCMIYPNVFIGNNTVIGDNVIIHANTVVGKDAFYYNKQEGAYHKMHTIGQTIIEDDVEIGSNCTIDNGVSGITRIGKGTKLDNQIHIAHGVEIGDNCLLCAQVAVAGKTIIGDNCVLYGKVGISKGLKIGENSIILASSNVNKNLEGNNRYYGSPAIEARLAMKYFASLKMLPKFMQRTKHLLNKSYIDS